MNFKDAPWRLRVAGLVLLAAAALVAATAAGAQAPFRGATVFTHSAASGELRGGRLILHGVSGRVTWATSSGRSGVVSVKRLHRRMFRRATPAATGTLHVAGHHGGDEPTFRLSKPRYNRAGRTVSYRARQLDNKPLPGASVGAAAAARRFGAASLSIIGAPRAIGGGDDEVCEMTLTNNAAGSLFLDEGTALSSTWTKKPPDIIKVGDSATWSATGSVIPGCQTIVSWAEGAIVLRGYAGGGTCMIQGVDLLRCRKLDQKGLSWSVEPS